MKITATVTAVVVSTLLAIVATDKIMKVQSDESSFTYDMENEKGDYDEVSSVVCSSLHHEVEKLLLTPTNLLKMQNVFFPDNSAEPNFVRIFYFVNISNISETLASNEFMISENHTTYSTNFDWTSSVTFSTISPTISLLLEPSIFFLIDSLVSGKVFNSLNFTFNIDDFQCVPSDSQLRDVLKSITVRLKSYAHKQGTLDTVDKTYLGYTVDAHGETFAWITYALPTISLVCIVCILMIIVPCTKWGGNLIVSYFDTQKKALPNPDQTIVSVIISAFVNVLAFNVLIVITEVLRTTYYTDVAHAYSFRAIVMRQCILGFSTLVVPLILGIIFTWLICLKLRKTGKWPVRGPRNGTSDPLIPSDEYATGVRDGSSGPTSDPNFSRQICWFYFKLMVTLTNFGTSLFYVIFNVIPIIVLVFVNTTQTIMLVITCSLVFAVYFAIVNFIMSLSETHDKTKSASAKGTLNIETNITKDGTVINIKTAIKVENAETAKKLQIDKADRPWLVLAAVLITILSLIGLLPLLALFLTVIHKDANSGQFTKVITTAVIGAISGAVIFYGKKAFNNMDRIMKDMKPHDEHAVQETATQGPLTTTPSTRWGQLRANVRLQQPNTGRYSGITNISKLSLPSTQDKTGTEESIPIPPASATPSTTRDTNEIGRRVPTPQSAASSATPGTSASTSPSSDAPQSAASSATPSSIKITSTTPPSDAPQSAASLATLGNTDREEFAPTFPPSDGTQNNTSADELEQAIQRDVISLHKSLVHGINTLGHQLEDFSTGDRSPERHQNE